MPGSAPAGCVATEFHDSVPNASTAAFAVSSAIVHSCTTTGPTEYDSTEWTGNGPAEVGRSSVTGDTVLVVPSAATTVTGASGVAPGRTSPDSDFGFAGWSPAGTVSSLTTSPVAARLTCTVDDHEARDAPDPGDCTCATSATVDLSSTRTMTGLASAVVNVHASEPSARRAVTVCGSPTASNVPSTTTGIADAGVRGAAHSGPPGNHDPGVTATEGDGTALVGVGWDVGDRALELAGPCTLSRAAR